MNYSIRTEDLRKEYQMGELTVKALEGVNLEIEKGSFTSIMGPSGSGKSTLMHMIGLLDAPSSGEVYLSGKKTSKLSDRQKAHLRMEKIGFVFQFYSLLSGFTALENVFMPLVMKGKPKKEARKSSREALEKVRLADRLDHTPEELSGGQRQRVAIARALVNQPEIVLADEPNSQLDTETSNEIMGIFRDISESGQTVITVNHEQEHGEKADEVIWLEDGKITER
ncbi:MAG: ABC transporter ATP-binding protein [Candidatus Nanohaloarchaea archaeon]